MADSTQSRKFTAEMRRTTAGLSVDSRSELPVDDAAIRHQELLDAIRAMERKIVAVLSGQPHHAAATPALPSAPAAQPAAAHPSSQDTSDDDRMTALLEELHTLQKSIENTRREIAELRTTNGHRATPLITAGDELDAVVQATETATESILAAAERIDDVVGRLRNQASAEEDTTGIDEIGDQVIKIFESCNFQDITGQRITKVVNAMKFVEEKVERMIANLGGYEKIEQAIAEVEEARQVDPDDESHLLEGPQLHEENKVSQDDIDKLFG